VNNLLNSIKSREFIDKYNVSPKVKRAVIHIVNLPMTLQSAVKLEVDTRLEQDIFVRRYRVTVIVLLACVPCDFKSSHSSLLRDFLFDNLQCSKATQLLLLRVEFSAPSHGAIEERGNLVANDLFWGPAHCSRTVNLTLFRFMSKVRRHPVKIQSMLHSICPPPPTPDFVSCTFFLRVGGEETFEIKGWNSLSIT
jgi:hypothetical protein